MKYKPNSIGKLTTHVLDTSKGRPAPGVKIDVYSVSNNQKQLIAQANTNEDGRTDGPLLSGEMLQSGVYELLFHTGDYLMSDVGNDSKTPFLNEVPIRFGVDDATAHFHVPLLISPFGYSTYRGS